MSSGNVYAVLGKGSHLRQGDEVFVYAPSRFERGVFRTWRPFEWRQVPRRFVGQEVGNFASNYHFRRPGGEL